MSPVARPATESAAEPAPDLWRALASPSPWRRRLLDLLRDGPRTTGGLSGEIPELSRFAVMQHLAVLTGAGVVIAERRGRDRLNYLNPVPLRDWYERWVQPMADTGAASLLALKRATEATGARHDHRHGPDQDRPAGLRAAHQRPGRPGLRGDDPALAGLVPA